MPALAVSPTARRYWSQYRRVPGWFDAADFLVFDWLLNDQERNGVKGDLLEIGAFLGRSAILLGLHAGSQDGVHVCDLFELGPSGQESSAYAGTAYQGLSRAAFEANYRRHVGTLPTIHQRPSAELAGVLPRDCRFVHLDGSHVYDFVVQDLEYAIGVTTDDGVIACDDYRNAHFPGVAAAVWAEVAAGRLFPVCVTSAKLYASTSRPEPIQARMQEWVAGHPVLTAARQRVAGVDVVCLQQRRAASFPEAVREWVPPAARRLLRTDRAWRGAGDA